MGKVPENRRKIIGNNIRILIKDRGYRTLELFAHENDIDKSWLGRVVAGKIDGGFQRMILVTEALGVTLNDLWPGKPKAGKNKAS